MQRADDTSAPSESLWIYEWNEIVVSNILVDSV